MFSTTGKNGFHITFSNGYTVSVQWSCGNYCANRNNTSTYLEGIKSPNAEVAAWDADGTWYVFDNGDTVKGYQTPEQAAEFIGIISNLSGMLE